MNRRQLSRLWDRASIYLPALLMAVVALGTYWLVRTTPGLVQDALPREVRHEPDYFMTDFSLYSYTPQAQLSDTLSGTRARHFPDTQTVEVEQPDIQTIGSDGRITLITARHAVGNADGSEMQLSGQARVIRRMPPGAADSRDVELEGEFLHFFRRADEVRSHLPVIITRGQDVLQGDSLRASNLDSVLEMQGRVRGTLMPANTAASRR